MGYRSNCHGLGMAVHGDKTTTGATCLSSLPNATEHGSPVVRMGDKTTVCPKCGKVGTIISGEPRVRFLNVPVAVDQSVVACGCPPGVNRVIAPVGQWMGCGPSPKQLASEKQTTQLAARQAAWEAEKQHQEQQQERIRVFAKSCLRGEGCNDAGNQPEPHTNFAPQAFFQAALAGTVRVPAATAGANVLELVTGRALTYGTWAVRSASVAAGGMGAPVAGLLVGMMPGRLNDGEQDFIDRMRAEQMHEAPSRVRFTWENDATGQLVPRGWHTPPGKDSVRVRNMVWDDFHQAYTYTTEEESPVTIVWTPDNSGVQTPSHTGNQNRPRLPDPVIIDPLPSVAEIEATTTPVPEEKGFADYILILPLPDIPPIYIYLSKPRSGLPEDNHSYHHAPNTEDILGIKDIQKARKRTPVQGGGGLRERWVDNKGRRIYEWDAQHGELEVYRASDGEHLGSVNYVTGKQLKPAVKGRNIKRYL